MRHRAVEVEAHDFGQFYADVLVLAYYVSDRGGDLAGGQHADCHLVKEGLEQVVVTPVDEGDVDGVAAE